MGIFDRWRREGRDDEDERVESFAEQVSNPELLAAEREVNELPRHEADGDFLGA
ncbi:MAG: hypothetical protein M0004_03180 [Actinomycetota bacterium]|nr:hypothetical protein [Actinomycetota bacterium]